MSEFTVVIQDRDFAPVVTTGLTLTPVSWEAEALGGPSYAALDVTGDQPALWAAWGQWLGYHMWIINGAGTAVWWGMITETELMTGAASVNISLEQVFNRINVDYAFDDMDGEPQSAETGWAQDDASVVRYGRLEERISRSDIEGEEAEQKRATWLNETALPQPVAAQVEGTQVLHVQGTGWVQMLARVYYANQLGRMVYDQSSNVEHMLGWKLTTDWAIGFARKVAPMRIHDLKARLYDVTVGTKLDVSGSAINNGAFTVTGAPQKPDMDHVVYVTNDVFFSSADEMYDNLGGFGVLTSGEMIYVSRYPTGTALNEGAYFLQGVEPGNIEVWPSTVLDEGTGLTIQFEQGHSLRVDESVENEFPSGATVTLESRGVRIAQSFQIENFGASWQASEIMVRVRKVGAPTGPLYVRIYTDSAGSPGTAVAEGSLAVADIRTVAEWVTVPLDVPYTLQPTTIYWVAVSGAPAGADCYTVGLTDDEDAQYSGGACKIQLANGAWEVRWGEPVSMPFQVWGTVETSEQVRAIVVSALPYASDAVVRTGSGIWKRQYRDGQRRAYDEIADLVETGDAAGKRLRVLMTPERLVLIDAQPADDGVGPRLDVGTGNLRQGGGGLWEAGALPVGQWVYLDGVEALGALLGGLRGFVADSAAARMTRESATGLELARIELRAAGRRLPWDV